MSLHRVLLPGVQPSVGDRLEILGAEAHHAVRVKRLGEGGVLEILNGSGCRAAAGITGVVKVGKGAWSLLIEVTEVVHEHPVQPQVEVLASAPKGPRLEEMIDQLSQVGAAAWAPLVAERTVVEPGAGKLAKAERIAGESAKQCGRSWLMSIGEPAQFREVLGGPGAVLADGSGGAYEHDGAERVTLLVGPEGGFTRAEVAVARDAGVRVCRFGPHAMRVETAAVVAAGVVLGRAGAVGRVTSR